RRHEVARQAFSFERDFDRLDPVRDQLCGGAEGIAAGKAPRLRLRPEGIGEVFGRPVVHGGSEEMIPRADSVPALQGRAASLQNPFPHRCERLAPDVRVISSYRRTSRENLPGCCAAVVSGAQRAHELKVQLTRLETCDPCRAALYAIISHVSPPPWLRNLLTGRVRLPWQPKEASMAPLRVPELAASFPQPLVSGGSV